MMTETAFHELAALYADLGRELSRLGVTCEACGECCCFERAEHVLYASSLEVEWLRRVAGRMPLINPCRCPYQVGDQCTARQGRMLGCRLHFCAAVGVVKEKLEELSGVYHARLQRIHDRNNLGWQYRPLHLALGD